MNKRIVRRILALLYYISIVPLWYVLSVMPFDNAARLPILILAGLMSVSAVFGVFVVVVTGITDWFNSLPD